VRVQVSRVKTEVLAFSLPEGTSVCAKKVGGSIQSCYCTLHVVIIARNSTIVARTIGKV